MKILFFCCYVIEKELFLTYLSHSFCSFPFVNNSKGDKTKLDSETPGKRKTTTHIYATGAGTSGQTPQGLTPHTDPYDVVVAQIQGTKLWTLCTPNPKTLSDVFREEGVNDGDMMVTEADKCELKLQEAFKKHDEASFYAEEDMKEFDCRNVTMNPGDTLYVPKGLVCILKHAHILLSARRTLRHCSLIPYYLPVALYDTAPCTIQRWIHVSSFRNV